MIRRIVTVWDDTEIMITVDEDNRDAMRAVMNKCHIAYDYDTGEWLKTHYYDYMITIDYTPLFPLEYDHVNRGVDTPMECYIGG